MAMASEADTAGAAPGAKAGKAYSLRRRLIASVLGASVLVWAISLAIVVHVAWRETSDVFDDALKEGARLALVLGSALEGQGALSGGESSPEASEPAKLALYYQVVGDDGRVLRRAAKAPARPFSDELQVRSGYRDVWVEGEAWRIYLLRAKEGRFQVQIGQPWDERLDLLEEMAEALVWPALALLALLAGFCWWVIRRLLQPLERTAGRIAAKSPQDLLPVPMAGEPRELRPLVRAFNLVLERLAQALQAERRFTADAAHELRTPLAALRMRIQLMQRQQSAQAPGTASAGAVVTTQSLLDEVDRSTALVASLLALARLDPERQQTLATEPVDLPALMAALDDGSAQARSMQLSVDCRVPSMQAHAVLLQGALRNIVDNALRYGVSGGRVHVEALATAEGSVRIAVRDDGPGVSEPDRRRLGERFFRVLGHREVGSGLGLSIVARIAALHGATLSFESGLAQRGLGVVLTFPGALLRKP